MSLAQLLAGARWRRCSWRLSAGDTRYALVPVEIHAHGDGVVLRLVMADTRTRTVVWVGELLAPGGAGMIAGLATRVADLVIEP